jgi:uncharacterized membrane protein (UPF0136 family)
MISLEITRSYDDNTRRSSYLATMKKIVLTFGLISGAISSAMMFATLPLMHRDVVNFDNGLILGYASILLSLLLVFFGIRSYRDHVGGGTVTFGRAFTVGILITVISCLSYVVSWEIIYYKITPDFMEKWSAHEIAKLHAKGASAAVVEAKRQEMAELKKKLDNPLFNAAMTFIEPFPVGLLVTLISAAILRRKPRTPATAAALA